MVEQVNFKEFMKRRPDYIRIYKEKETDTWRLYGSSDIDLKVFNEMKKQNVIYEVIEEAIKINVSYSKGWDDKNTYKEPTQLNFHHSDCETLKTLLDHNFKELNITYWPNSTSENSRRQNAKCELVLIRGLKFNKNGKLLKSHRISLTTPSYFGSIASRY